MNRYLVVSYDDDQQQWFYDTVRAKSSEEAAAFVCRLRPYVIAADAMLHLELVQMAWKVLENDPLDAYFPVCECQDCGHRFPENRLKGIKDIHERAAPGEPMPSGECPECGAVCHVVQESA